MSITHDKPKLIFFQSKYADGLPEFLLTHKQEHVNCLSVFFDVTVIQNDCDYEQICDLYQPDLALFESGVNLLTCKRPKITNVRRCDVIPKLGLLNADAWCETRSGSLSDMDQWGIETLFSISTTIAEHLPSIGSQVFVWPNFVDPTIYRDYNEAKLIPALLSGATAAQYPWRRRVYKLIAEHYPSLWCPHRGYLSRSSAGQVLHGVQYARTINASWVAPVCGTVAKEVVRKHFEIPACNTCLITERARNLEEAGFVDMTNCVFADDSDILDKLEFLFEHPDRLRAITTAGYSLVHSRHTQQNRDQILQWFNLNKTLQCNEKILQPGLFEPLTVDNTFVRQPSSHPLEVGTHLRLLREGDEKLYIGQVAAAESKYRRCLSYMFRLPEARFKIALCQIYKGNAADANERIFELIQYCVSEYEAADPDPVEWAYYIISFLCMGKLKSAKDCAIQFSWLRHQELDRVRAVVHALNQNPYKPVDYERSTSQRVSIHQLPERSDTEWRTELYDMLRACGQSSIAEMIVSGDSQLQLIEKTRDTNRSVQMGSGDTLQSRGTSYSSIKYSRRIFSSAVLDRKLIQYRVRRKLKHINDRVTRMLQQVGLNFSRMPRGNDARFVAAIRDVTRDFNIRTALVIDCGSDKGVSEAILDGALGNDGTPLICRVSDFFASFAGGNGADSRGGVKWPMLSDAIAWDAFTVPLEESIQRFKYDNAIDHFGAVMMAWPEMAFRAGESHQLHKEICAAGLVVLSSLQGEFQQEIYAQLLARPDYVLLDHDSSGDGYAIFRSRSCSNEQTAAASTQPFSLSCFD